MPHANDDAQRRALQAALHLAVQRGQLHLQYQPLLDLRTGAIVGTEALLRWQHPTLGVISPEHFIPMAEEAGLMGPIGDWALLEACRTAAGWQRAGLAPTRMMVNLAARQLQRPDLAARIARVLAETGLEPKRLGLELSEGRLMERVDALVSQLERLRTLGIEIALDDFGIGHSSLGQLRRLPIDVVKIDHSLVPAVSAPGEALAIVRAVIAMAHSLGKKVVAEGVETEAQAELLAAHGCDQVQGFGIAPPAAREPVEALLRGERGALLPRRARRQRSLLLVDAQPTSLQRTERLLAARFGEALRIIAVSELREALRVLKEQPLDLIVTDLKLAGGDGLGLLGRAQDLQPQALCMLSLGAGEMAAVVEDPRQVEVFRYLSKTAAAEQAVAHFRAALAAVERRSADRVLAEAIGRRGYQAGALERELRSLENEDPGITHVERGPLGEVVLPSSLATLPGDLWARPR